MWEAVPSGDLFLNALSTAYLNLVRVGRADGETPPHTIMCAPNLAHYQRVESCLGTGHGFGESQGGNQRLGGPRLADT